MARAKSASVVDQAVANLRTRQPAAWWHRVDPKHKAVMDELAAAWFDGRLGKEMKPASEAIAKTLGDLGVAKIGFQGVQHWLRNARKA